MEGDLKDMNEKKINVETSLVNLKGTIACQVYSLNRKIIYAAWARNFSALKPFFDA